MRLLGLMVAAVLVLSAPARAQDDAPPATGLMPPLAANALDDSTPLRLSPDGPAVIKLSEDAASVIIGNPAHATAVLENPRLMMLVPLQPGATKVIALNRDGKAILNKHVLVGSGRDGFKRITRVCATAQSGTCAPVAMYYCPDKCYETAVPEPAAQPGATGTLSNPASDVPENPATGGDVSLDESMSVLQ